MVSRSRAPTSRGGRPARWRPPGARSVICARTSNYRLAVAHGETAPLDPAVGAAIESFAPYHSVMRRVGLLSTPVAIVVPVARRLRGESGVSTGPKLVTLLNTFMALALTHYVRQPARWERLKHRKVPGWAAGAGLIYLTLSPAAAARWNRGVILRGRSPLWAGLIAPSSALRHALLFVGYRRYRAAMQSQAKVAEEGKAVLPGAGSPDE